MSRKPRPKIKVYLPPDLHRELKEHSHAHGVSMAHVIRTLVRHDLQNAGSSTTLTTGPVHLGQNGGRS